MELTVYTANYCPYCLRTKALLQKKGVPFVEVDVTTDQEQRRWLVEQTGQMTIPQTFLNGQYIGNNDELHRKDASGELDRLLAEAGA